MKRTLAAIFAMLAAGTMCIVLAGCGGSSDDIDPELTRERPVQSQPVQQSVGTDIQQGNDGGN